MSKKIVFFTVLASTLCGMLYMTAYAAPTGNTLDTFKVVGTSTITPRNASDTFQIPSLKSVTCVGTNASGTFGTGTCPGGGGGSSSTLATSSPISGVAYFKDGNTLSGTSSYVSSVNGATGTVVVSAGVSTSTANNWIANQILNGGAQISNMFYIPAAFTSSTCANSSTVVDLLGCAQAIYDSRVGVASSVIIIAPVGNFPASSTLNGYDAGTKLGFWGQGDGTQITWTGAQNKTIITINDALSSSSVNHRQNTALANFYLKCSNATTTNPTVGVLLGGSNGAANTVATGLTLDGCGNNYKTASNTYFVTLEHSVVKGGGRNIYISQAANAGEGITFDDVKQLDCGNASATGCFYIDDFATTKLTFSGSNDNAYIYIGQGDLNVTINGTLENSNTNIPAGPMIYATSSAQTNVHLPDTTFINDRGNLGSFIMAGANINAAGAVAYRSNNASTTTSFISTLPGSYSITGFGFANQNSAVLAFFNSDTNCLNAQFDADSNGAYSFCIYQDGSNITHFINGNSDQGNLDNNGVWSFKSIVASTTLSVTQTSTLKGNVSTSIASALINSNAAGILTAYAGSSCTNQGVSAISATGTVTCTTFATSTGSGGGGGGNLYVTPTSTTLANNLTKFQTAGSSTISATTSIYSLPNGDVQIGTTTDNGAVNIVNSSGVPLFRGSTSTIATSSVSLRVLNNSSTAGTLYSGFEVLGDGHLNATGTLPVVSSCGTSPAITGSDVGGTVTVGSVSATSCTVTFQIPYEATPSCLISSESSLTTAPSYTISTTALVVSDVGSLVGVKFHYFCHLNL